MNKKPSSTLADKYGKSISTIKKRIDEYIKINPDYYPPADSDKHLEQQTETDKGKSKD